MLQAASDMGGVAAADIEVVPNGQFKHTPPFS
jgi:hypothetical protein